MKISTVKRGFEIMLASTTPKEKWCGVVPDEKYMDGVGVLKKTQDLTDEMFGLLPQAILGGFVFTTSFGALGGFVALYIVDPFIVSSCIVSAIFGVWVMLPFLYAISDLQDHADKMNAETERLGRGWGRS